MKTGDYTELERTLFGSDDLAGLEIVLSDVEAEQLVASGRYRPSTGYPYTASHYRRSNDDGSCLHLVWRDGVAHLHRDRFDPHASPLSLMSLSRWGARVCGTFTAARQV